MKFAVLVLTLCFFSGIHAQFSADDGETCRVNLGMVVDKSGSIVVDQVPQNYQNWIDVRNFLLEITRFLDVSEMGSWVGVVTFGNEARVDIPITFIRDNPLEDLEEKISNLEYPNSNGRFFGEKTNTSGGLQVAFNQLFPPSVRNREQTMNILLLVTDGNATKTGNFNQNLIQTANTIKASDIRIIGVGVTDQISERELKDLVTNEETDYIPIDNFDALKDFLERTILTVCSVPTTTPAPPQCDSCCELSCSTINAPPPCFTSCPMECRGLVTCPNLFPVRLPDGLCGTADQCPREEIPCVEACRIDLLLVVDESGSIGGDKGINYWERDVRPFILNIIDRVDVGFFETHVGMITFGNDALVRFPMDAFNSSSAMKDAVPEGDECRCTQGGRTNSSGALRLAHQQLGQNAGDRPEVPNVVLFITDGADNVDEEFFIGEAALVDAEALLITVGVSEDVNVTRLQSILHDPEDYFHVEEFELLADILESLIDRTCNKCDDDDEECPEPTPVGHVHAFHAYTWSMRMRNRILVMNQMFTNYGGGYNTQSGIYTCTCSGMYMFLFTYSDVDCDMAVYIVQEEESISAVGYVDHHGSMSVQSIHYCAVGQRVWVQVLEGGEDIMATTYVDPSNPTKSLATVSFSGHMLYAME